MKTLKSLILLLLILCITHISFAEIKIGAITDMSGPTSIQTPPLIQSYADYFRNLNEQGGIKGEKVTFIQKDSEYKPQVALKHYSELRDQGVVALLPQSTGTMFNLSLHLKKDKIPAIPISLYGPLVNPVHPYIFFSGAPYSDQFLALLKYASDHPKEKGRPVRVAFAFNSSAFGRAPLVPAQILAKKLGVEVVAKQIVEMNVTDADEAAKKIIASKPDYVINMNIASPAIALAKSFKKLGATDITSMGTFFVANNAVIKKGGEAVDGMIVSSIIARPEDIDSPLYKRMKQIYKKYQGDIKNLSVSYAIGYMDCEILVQAITALKEKGLKVTGENIKNALEDRSTLSIGNISAPDFNYSKTNHVPTNKVKIYKVNAKQKKFELISDWVGVN